MMNKKICVETKHGLTPKWSTIMYEIKVKICFAIVELPLNKFISLL